MSSHFHVLAMKALALATLSFCLLSAFGLFVGQAIGEVAVRPLAGYFLYCVATALLACEIYRARPMRGEPGGTDARAPAVSPFRFLILVIVVISLMALTVPALAFGAVDSGYLLYFVVVSLLAWGTYRGRSIARALITLLLAGGVFVALVGGAFHSRYDGGGPQ